jgi:hypothetical protein
MSDKRLDKLFKEKLGNRDFDYSDSYWADFEKSFDIDAAINQGGATGSGGSLGNIISGAKIGLIAIPVIIITGLAVLVPNNNDNTTAQEKIKSERITTIKENQITIENSNPDRINIETNEEESKQTKVLTADDFVQSNNLTSSSNQITSSPSTSQPGDQAFENSTKPAINRKSMNSFSDNSGPDKPALNNQNKSQSDNKIFAESPDQSEASEIADKQANTDELVTAGSLAVVSAADPAKPEIVSENSGGDADNQANTDELVTAESLAVVSATDPAKPEVVSENSVGNSSTNISSIENESGFYNDQPAEGEMPIDEETNTYLSEKENGRNADFVVISQSLDGSETQVDSTLKTKNATIGAYRPNRIRPVFSLAPYAGVAFISKNLSSNLPEFAQMIKQRNEMESNKTALTIGLEFETRFRGFSFTTGINHMSWGENIKYISSP